MGDFSRANGLSQGRSHEMRCIEKFGVTRSGWSIWREVVVLAGSIGSLFWSVMIRPDGNGENGWMVDPFVLLDVFRAVFLLLM